MMNINIKVEEHSINEIKNKYGIADYTTVVEVIQNIIDRYLSVEYFDTKYKTIEIGDYQICKLCNENAKSYRMFDVDGTNLEEHLVCGNCGSGHPKIK